ncbi:unnamed protein product [Paramecium sonneborni]|uniref:Uncharacterized protein n=1 Tax=Paramecium sonneborni TaxID=65129 RepID=A0A8S1R5Y5_9CILI|nr:unnamed protein product [Paramecium sonneborni]
MNYRNGLEKNAYLIFQFSKFRILLCFQQYQFTEQKIQELKYQLMNNISIQSRYLIQTKVQLEEQQIVQNTTSPICKGKCDEIISIIRHQYIHGNQIRGMIGMLIDCKPSLYTYEEIQDDYKIKELQNLIKQEMDTNTISIIYLCLMIQAL